MNFEALVMTVAFARPDVSDLVFHLYERSIHPELFQIYASTELEQEHYSLLIQICEAGHVVTLDYGGVVMTEVNSSASWA